MSGPAETKEQLRRQARARRDALTPTAQQAAALALAARPFPVEVKGGLLVSGFSPVRGEINPVPLMRRLVAGGARLALPVVQGRGMPLLFRTYAFGDPLGSGVWGICEPLPTAVEVAPDLVLVPLLAFDRTGERIGYGAGYYDLTLQKLRENKAIVAIGIAFAAQEIAAVPVTASDARLDLVLTECEVIDCREIPDAHPVRW